MKETKIICDKCGKKIKEKFILHIIDSFKTININEFKNYHFCSKCYKEFNNWMKTK